MLHRRTLALLLVVLAAFASPIACDRTDGEAPAANAPAAEPTGPPTPLARTVGELTLELPCPPSWTCDVAIDAPLVHRTRAARLELHRSRADSAEAMLADEARRRLEARWLLVEESSHPLGVVQIAERKMPNGANSRRWGLLRGVGGVPLVCYGIAAKADFPALVDDFAAMCEGLHRPGASPHASAPASPEPTPEPTPEPLAIDAPPDPLALLVTATAPAVPLRFDRLAWRMTEADVAHAMPELRNGRTTIAGMDVRTHFWGPLDQLNGLSFTIDAATVGRDQLLEHARAAWGEPVESPLGMVSWAAPDGRLQAVLETPSRQSIRLTLRPIQTFDDFLGLTGSRFGFEARGPVLGAPRAQIREAHDTYRSGDQEAIALPPLPTGSAVPVWLHGDPVESLEIALDFRRDPAAMSGFLNALAQRFGTPTEELAEDGAHLSHYPGPPRITARRSDAASLVSLDVSN